MTARISVSLSKLLFFLFVLISPLAECVQFILWHSWVQDCHVRADVWVQLCWWGVQRCE